MVVLITTIPVTVRAPDIWIAHTAGLLESINTKPLPYHYVNSTYIDRRKSAKYWFTGITKCFTSSLSRKFPSYTVEGSKSLISKNLKWL